VTATRAVRFIPARELPQPCLRCGAVATHYLTCPSLRLPAGYRAGDDARRVRLTFSEPAAEPAGGPDHPDWPLPPQRADW
jgi:hypothetical protein